MLDTARQRFLDFVRNPATVRPICSPFLPHPSVIKATLEYLGLEASGDPVADEIKLAGHLDYEPMFMTDLTGLIFDWRTDDAASSREWEVATIETSLGTWVRHRRRGHDQWNDEGGCPIQTETDHRYFLAVCEQVEDREAAIRRYYRDFRQRVGDHGVIVIGHPHPSWLGYQISPSTLFYHWNDYRATFARSMEALYGAALYVMSIALEEEIDFMSDSSYGLEMTSPSLFEEMDLPYIHRFATWTHARGGLFWYHNCGHTRGLILDGTFNRLGADLIETVAPPPEGDNDLAESRAHLDPAICTKGNFSLGLLRDGDVEDVRKATRSMVESVRDRRHVYSTADGVLEGTPPENFVVFVRTVRELTT